MRVDIRIVRREIAILIYMVESKNLSELTEILRQNSVITLLEYVTENFEMCAAR